MKVTGYRLREAIKLWELRLKSLLDSFGDSMYAFPEEKKRSPKELMGDAEKAADAIALLQTAQGQYNLNVAVSVAGERVSLLEAVKAIGMAGRFEKIWRGAVGKKNRRWNFYNEVPTRQEGEVVASMVMSQQEVLDEAHKAAVVASAFRSAIASGNATEVEIDWLEPWLFE